MLNYFTQLICFYSNLKNIYLDLESQAVITENH